MKTDIIPMIERGGFLCFSNSASNAEGADGYDNAMRKRDKELDG